MIKTIFISYSHDSEEHKAWVKRFADDLALHGGFEVLLDQNLPKGSSFPRFMELGLSVSDKVLVIGTPEYKKKATLGHGVAFEEAIIGSDLMQNIDSTKYYPVLREGSFDTSFPPILQGRNGDDISDDSKYDAVLHSIIDSLHNEKELPTILQASKIAVVQPQQPIASVYLGVNIMLHTQFGVPTGQIAGVAFGVTVTNLSNETKYFNSPYFKLSIPIEGDVDSCQMLNTVQRIDFPYRLEKGQQFSISYKLVPGNVEMFSQLLSRDSSVTLKAIVTTTLKESIESEAYSISNLVKDFKYIK